MSFKENPNEYPVCCLISPKGAKIIFDGLYPQTIIYALDKAKLSSIVVTHHLFHLAQFFADLLNSGFHECATSTFENHFDLVVLFDWPSPRRLKKLNRAQWLKTIVCEVENPIYSSQQKSYDSSVRVISSFRNDAWAISQTAYIYSSIPAHIKRSSHIDYQTKTSSILCSNLAGPKTTLYGFRRHVINVFSDLERDNFIFFGKGWIHQPIHKASLSLTSIRLSMLNSFNFSKALFRRWIQNYPRCDLSCYRGEALSKEVLHSCRTTLAIENTIQLPGYVTEKAIEPLIYGCLPLYVGTKTNNFLASYIDILPPDVLGLVAACSSYQQKPSFVLKDQAEIIRCSINSDLASGRILTSLGITSEILRNY